MGEQYSHTLIAIPKDFVPTGSQVQKFFKALVAQNVLPGNQEVNLRVLTGKFREYPYVNPFTGQKMRVEIKDRKKVDSLDGISQILETLEDFELEMAGSGRPIISPLPIEFDEPYHVGVTCRIYSKYRSTSDSHEETDNEMVKTPYGKICSELREDGRFTNPHTMENLVIPRAGYARFWIEFKLGKFLFPQFQNGSLEILNPFVVAEAERAFEISFVQGCYWG